MGNQIDLREASSDIWVRIWGLQEYLRFISICNREMDEIAQQSGKITMNPEKS